MKLTNPTNAELNAAFATEICGYKFLHAEHRFDSGVHVAIDGISKPDGQWLSAIPDFCSDANAVLPWLEKFNGPLNGPDVSFQSGQWEVVLNGCTTRERAVHSVFPKAAVIALLRAHGVEIETT